MLRFLAFLLAACSTLAADDIQMSVPGDSIANACRLFASGDLYCWGDGTVTGGTPLWTSTSSVTAEKVLTGVSAVAVGGGEDSGSLFVCAIMSTDQTVKCWGNNNKGQCGQGNTDAVVASPTEVANLTGVTKIDAGPDVACAVAGGKAYCWGNTAADSDQRLRILGGTWANASGVTTPTVVPGFDSGVTDVLAGGRAVCFLKSGAVSCYGEFFSGQAPDGPMGGANTDFVRLAKSNANYKSRNVCAVKDDNSGGPSSVHCWGKKSDIISDNNYITVGDSLTKLLGATAVAVGEQVVCGIVGADVKCTGENDNFQASGTSFLDFDPVSGATISHAARFDDSPATAVACGDKVCCAVVTGGNLYCWGYAEDLGVKCTTGCAMKANGETNHGTKAPMLMPFPSTASPTPAPTASPTPAPTTSPTPAVTTPDEGKLPIPIIAGGAGGAVLLCLLLVCCVCRRRYKKKGGGGGDKPAGGTKRENPLNKF